MINPQVEIPFFTFHNLAGGLIAGQCIAAIFGFLKITGVEPNIVAAACLI